MKNDRNIKGATTELKVAVALTALGWHVCRPITDYCHVDFVGIDTDYKTHKIQVKSPKATATGFSLALSKPSTKEQYKAHEVDYFATVFEDKLYLIPFKSATKRHISFCTNSEKQHQFPAHLFELK
jgi:hypothetical protein